MTDSLHHSYLGKKLKRAFLHVQASKKHWNKNKSNSSEISENIKCESRKSSTSSHHKEKHNDENDNTEKEDSDEKVQGFIPKFGSMKEIESEYNFN